MAAYPSYNVLFNFKNMNNFSWIYGLVFILLAGCAGDYEGDGKVVGVCKSCKPYFVRGGWHYPQQHYEYDEEGLASWYGPGFHGKPKPYGEPFDQNALTAAHKTLPLPSVVLVTNLENNKSVKLVVDDRGPFVYENRIIDLSVAAAKAIDSYKKGVANVRVQSLVAESHALATYLTRYGRTGRDPSGRTWVEIYQQEIDGNVSDQVSYKAAPLPKPVKKIQSKKIKVNTYEKLDSLLKEDDDSNNQPSAPGKFYIDIQRMFVQKKNAESFAKSFAKSYPVGIKRTKHRVGQVFYEVRIGPFNKKREAKLALQNILKDADFSATLVQP